MMQDIKRDIAVRRDLSPPAGDLLEGKRLRCERAVSAHENEIRVALLYEALSVRVTVVESLHVVVGLTALAVDGGVRPHVVYHKPDGYGIVGVPDNVGGSAEILLSRVVEPVAVAYAGAVCHVVAEAAHIAADIVIVENDAAA